jgi:Rhodopirellula transposase DDE domain
MGADAGVAGLMGPQLEVLLPVLDERARRLVLGAVARAAGEGGVTAVARVAGASWQTVADGAAELESGLVAPEGRVRRPGGGRKKLADTDPGLVPALLELVEDSSRGDPESPLRWTTKSVKNLSGELTAAGHPCSGQTCWRLLREHGFSTQSNARVSEGKRHPDRDAQFRQIAAQAGEHLAAGQPVISVDAKKKELVGEYGQKGREWRRAGDPVRVRSHDFPDEDSGHAIPYGVYDVGANTGFVNVGTDRNTAALAVESVRRWWDLVGRDAYPHAGRLLVTCDAGGSNGWQNRTWKAGIAAVAQEAGLEVTVCHFPPGTSKWNKIEHRLFSQITLAWRGRPLTSHDVIINTIGAVTTATGLTVTAVLDENPYPAGIQVSDEQMHDLEDRALTRHAFHGDWNYTLPPAPRPAPHPRPQPGQPPPARSCDLTCWNHPALTGLDPAALDALTAALALPAAARREQQLFTRRGGQRRRRPNTRPSPRLTLSPAGRILATCLHQHLGIPAAALARLIGADHSTVSEAVKDTRALLAQAGHHIPPGPARCRTPDDLRRYAASHGITLPGPAPAPPSTPTPRDTPQTHIILECLPERGNGPSGGPCPVTGAGYCP